MIFEITSNPNVASSYQLTREDRITALEREIFALRKGKEAFDGVEIPRHLPARPPIPTAVNRVDNPPTHEPTEASQVTNPPSVSAPAPAASSTPSPATVPAPIHPYSQARDATYAPPQDRNLGVLPKPPKDKDAAYKTSAPVQDPRIAEDVFNRSMKAPLLTLTPEDFYPSLQKSARNIAMQ
ncbi:hypothetical protein A0H81_06077 [Grifola frondosa]|uniref:Uncharacterized protein n=1 Tax=Grifola frondosa TaxID=5627 RepID=A0A1C7MC30_GRIFR|nr:hypothetical protein A0H81_06077 [Grifola frondosa]